MKAMDDVRFPPNSSGDYPPASKSSQSMNDRAREDRESLFGIASAPTGNAGGGALGGPLGGPLGPLGPLGARTQYTMPGILHYLQVQWAKYELAKAQWDAERAELQVHTRPTSPFFSASLFPLYFESIHNTFPILRYKRRKIR